MARTNNKEKRNDGKLYELITNRVHNENKHRQNKERQY